MTEATANSEFSGWVSPVGRALLANGRSHTVRERKHGDRAAGHGRTRALHLPFESAPSP